MKWVNVQYDILFEAEQDVRCGSEAYDLREQMVWTRGAVNEWPHRVRRMIKAPRERLRNERLA